MAIKKKKKKKEKKVLWTKDVTKKITTLKNIFFFPLLTFVKKKNQSFYNIRPTIGFSNKLGKYSPCTSCFSYAFSSFSYTQGNVSEGIKLVCIF